MQHLTRNQGSLIIPPHHVPWRLTRQQSNTQHRDHLRANLSQSCAEMVAALRAAEDARRWRRGMSDKDQPHA